MMISPVSSPYSPYYYTPQKTSALQGASAGAYIQPLVEKVDGNSDGRIAGPVVGNNALKRLDQVECTTCRERRYNDVSDDPSVSFQTPQNIAPEASASIVRSHEQEHVSSEQASAQKDGKKIVSQTVQLYTSVCPECGKVYVSGGKTTTLSKAGTGNDNGANGAAPLQTPYISLAVDERT